MMKTFKILPTLALGGLLSTVLAGPVTIPGGTITGKTVNNIEFFNGIPYADSPTGLAGRLRPPRKLSTELGNFDATGTAQACPSGPVAFSLPSYALQAVDPSALEVVSPSAEVQAQAAKDPEDCLTVTVQRPAGTKEGDKLPVLFWIFGGGFVGGSTATFNAAQLINAGTSHGQPFIFVAVNYRLGGWGFLPGAEILRDGSANLGLLDQRMGLEWTADNIASFGGDPEKITIWGQSSGAISVFDHLVMYDGNATYNGKPLFRGAILNSGSITPVDPVDCPKGQAVYDQVVKVAKCDTHDDTLTCLRNLTNTDFAAAANSLPGIISYQALALSYLPRPDGKVLTASPDVLAKEGKIHAVPLIMGAQEDEGVLFTIFQLNVTTPERLVDYLATHYFHNANKDQITQLVNTYSAKPEDGSPFRQPCGPFFCELYAGRKRLSAILGDIVFNLVRRIAADIITAVKPDLPIWSYLASYNHGTGGTFHGSDVTVLFNNANEKLPSTSGRAYYINFLYNLDPNVGTTGLQAWPKWVEDKQLLWFNATENGLLADDYRNASYEFLVQHTDILRF